MRIALATVIHWMSPFGPMDADQRPAGSVPKVWRRVINPVRIDIMPTLVSSR